MAIGIVSPPQIRESKGWIEVKKTANPLQAGCWILYNIFLKQKDEYLAAVKTIEIGTDLIIISTVIKYAESMSQMFLGTN